MNKLFCICQSRGESNIRRGGLYSSDLGLLSATPSQQKRSSLNAVRLSRSINSVDVTCYRARRTFQQHSSQRVEGSLHNPMQVGISQRQHNEATIQKGCYLQECQVNSISVTLSQNPAAFQMGTAVVNRKLSTLSVHLFFTRNHRARNVSLPNEALFLSQHQSLDAVLILNFESPNKFHILPESHCSIFQRGYVSTE